MKMKRFLSIILTLCMVLSMLPVGAYAAAEKCVEFTVDSLGLGYQSYSSATNTVDGVGVEWIQLGNYGDGIQMRDKNGNTSMFWNTSAMGTGITRIELNYCSTREVKYANPDCVIFNFGNEAKGATYSTKLSTEVGVTTYTITPDADTYTYFYIEHDLGYGLYWDSIRVYYNESEDDDSSAPELVDGYYEIYTADQLYWFAEQVNSGNTAINGKLMADIVVNENVLTADGSLNGDGSTLRAWIPIGRHYNKQYTGTFDGNSKIVSGLYLSNYSDYVGLFGYVGDQGVVKNVGVTDSYFLGDYYVGGVVGYNIGNVNCCYNTGCVSGSDNVGGVAGYNIGTVSNCYNTGVVNGEYNVGGITGMNEYMVTGCFNIGTISGTSQYSVGPVVGENSYDGVYNCYYLIDCCDYFDHYADWASESTFISGAMVEWLQADQTEQVWGQELGVDKYPVLGGPKVYQLPSCGGEGWGYSNTEDAVLDHYYNEEVFPNDCEQDGYTQYICAWCGDIYADNEIPATGHSMVDGICQNCGDYEEPDSVGEYYYEIYNAGQLYWFAQRVSYGERYISGKLMADIVLNENVLNAEGQLNGDGSSFRPWVYTDDYYGTFDGNGKTISGLYINEPDEQFVGLFSMFSGGTIKNLCIEDAYIYANSYVGGITGSNNGAIVNCSFSGTVESSYFGAGGITGVNSGTISNCYMTGSVSGDYYVGGLTGQPGGKVYNSYYLEGVCDGSEQGVSMTAEQFASGQVAFLLQGVQSADVWGQEIGVDALPKLGGMRVYQDCAAATYSNDSTQSGSHSFQNGICEHCGAFEPAVLNGDVYEISNVGQLYWFAQKVNAGDTEINGKLMKDIVVNENVLINGGDDGWGWTPIGSSALAYQGQFDGNGKTISGLYCSDEDESDIGLFGAVGHDGAVKNVGVVDSYFEGGTNVGAVAGMNRGTVSGCYSESSVCSNYYYAGGIVGFNESGTVSDCYNTGTVTGGSRVGGVVGENSYGTVCESYNTGAVTGEEYVGGVAGRSVENAVWEVYNTGSVTGGKFVGGVVGCNLSNLSISYNTGSVTASGDYVGGIAGENYYMMYACYNLGDVSGGSYVGGVVGANGTYHNPYIYCSYNVGTVTGTGCYVGGLEGFHGISNTTGSYYLTGCATDGNGTVQNGIGAETLGSVTEDYESCVEGKTSEQFASGEVCYLLWMNAYRDYWGQKIGTDQSPVFSDDLVYESDGTYSNVRPYGNLNGTVASFVTNGVVTLELVKDGEVKDTTTVRGKNAEYAFSVIKPGDYILRLSKKDHPTREYEITVGNDDMTLDVMLSPYGDVTGDGNVNIKDFQRMLRHVNKTNPLKDYALACGDVTGDGNVNIKDFQRMLRHVNKTNPIYPDQKDVTIKVWAPLEDLTEGYSWLEEMQTRFEEEHPEYCIFWINEAVSQGDVGSVVMNDPSAAADVYMYANDQQLRLIEAGGLAQLTDIYADQVKADNTQIAIDSVTHTDGEIYGLPMEGNTWFLYYNKQVFTEEDVKNLDVMLEKGRVCLPFNNAWTAGAFFLGCGGTIFGENGRDVEAGIDFSGANGGYMAAKKMIELAQHSNAVLGGMDAYMLAWGDVDAVFSGYWDAAMLKEALGDNLGIAMLPKFTIDGEEYQMTAMSGTKCVGVNDYVDNSDGKLDLCMEFAALLASVEGQLLRYDMRGVTPIHVNLDENERVTANDVAMAEINTMRDASVLQPGFNEMSYFWTPMDTFARGIIYGEINLDNYEEMVDQLSEWLNNSDL